MVVVGGEGGVRVWVAFGEEERGKNSSLLFKEIKEYWDVLGYF